MRVTSGEFERWLKKQGCKIIVKRGKGGHVMVFHRGNAITLPRHG